MNRRAGILCALCALCAHAADASAHDIVGGIRTVESDHSAVSPEVTKSDKKFFGKDFPWDKRPKVDVLHFQHPYPVVQDSDDFDKDFIKDENSDNGSWKAQTEYDRLRHKLLKQKEELPQAERAVDKAEKELKAAMRRREEAEEERQKEAKEADEERAKVAKKAKTPALKPKKEIEPIPEPGAIASPGDVKVATDETEKAMAALGECKKQLAQARENLKKLMKELEVAKKEQKETEVAWDAARARSKGDDDENEKTQNVVKSDYQKYLDAREEFLREQARVAKMEVDIKVAAEKVRAIRDGADDGGGVYNTHSKSAAPSPIASHLGGLAILVLAYFA